MPGAQLASARIPADRLAPTADPRIFNCLNPPERDDTVEALVVPPIGWIAQPLKHSNRHDHQIWLSPSGNTAYGVIRFKLPLPLSPESVLQMGFLPEMKRTEGEATLISSQRDPTLPGIRFIAKGGKHVVRTNLMTRGFKGWAVYAGTLRGQPENPDDLALAELAREQTAVGLPK
ncbi:MAG TPA: hypothetical protein VLJ39_11870 [Tepidisphaeraceae bacterium]|nr:hypothetical protein [Tepidisphaeraceae bacterium]